jgi:hypothetical protein
LTAEVRFAHNPAINNVRYVVRALFSREIIQPAKSPKTKPAGGSEIKVKVAVKAMNSLRHCRKDSRVIEFLCVACHGLLAQLSLCAYKAPLVFLKLIAANKCNDMELT